MSLLRDSVQALQYIQRQQGWRSAFSLAGQFARAPFYEYRHGCLLQKSLPEPIEVPASGVSDSVRQLDAHNVALLETIMPPLRVKRIAGKLQAGEAGCVAIRDGKVIAYVLAGFAGSPSTKDANLELSSDQAYLWAGYALPEFRRQGVVREVNLSLCRYLQSRGYKSAILLVEQCNKASLGHCCKMGYELRETITYLRILRWRYSRRVPIQGEVRAGRSAG
jgi:ribosomal protein S18 acetylase RimI-like enzyme